MIGGPPGMSARGDDRMHAGTGSAAEASIETRRPCATEERRITA
jgi:hypothetical protein